MKIICYLCLGFALVASGCGGESGKEAADNQGSTENSGGNTPSGPSGNSGGGGGSTSGRGGSGQSLLGGMLGASSNVSDANKLKAIALGVINFQTASRKFPMHSQVSGKTNKSLSWRVLVTPYMELLNEYKKFDTKQAWDSGQNKPLVSSPASDAFTLSNGNLVCAIMHDKQASSFRDVMDGTSNTIMAMENPNAKAEQWTQPVDLTEAEALKLVKSLKKGEYLLAVHYDGSTCKIYSPEGKGLDDSEYAAIFGYRDGKPINTEIFMPTK